jgi:hypothetical protein
VTVPVTRRATPLIAGAPQRRSQLLLDQVLDQLADPATDAALDGVEPGFPANRADGAAPSMLFFSMAWSPPGASTPGFVASDRQRLRRPKFPTTSATAPVPIADEDKRTILGARSVLLFVEGDADSLDMALYRILFPNVTVEARGGCHQVVATVRSLRAISELHWLAAFGIVDRDGRNEEEIKGLRQMGIHVLPVCTVESLYYHPDAIRLVADQQATTFGCDGKALAAEAKARALDEFNKCRKRLIEPRCRSAAEQGVHAALRLDDAFWQSSSVTLPVDPAAILAKEETIFDGLIAEKDLVGLVARYGIKRTGVAAAVQQALRFQKVDDYAKALRARLKADGTARATLIRLLGDLPQILADASDPEQRAARASASPAVAAAG